MTMPVAKFYKSSFRSVYTAFIVLLMLLQMLLPGVALCFGTDGHITLESYDSGLCCESVLKPISNDDWYPDITDHSKINRCGPCVDVRVSDNNSEHKLLSSIDVAPLIDAYAFAAYVIPSFWFQENFKQGLIRQELPVGNSFLETLQTNILIC